MKRLAAALAVVCLTAVSVGVTATAPVGAAGPASTTVYTANAYSYAGGHPFDSAFCVNGTLLSNPVTEEVTGPYTVDSGSTTVDFFDSDSINCETDEPTASATVDLPPGGSVTLMGYWGFDGVRGVVMLDNQLDCVAANTGRLVVRNGADIGSTGSLDIYGTTPGGDNVLLVAGVTPGGQASADLPAGTYTSVYATNAGTQTVVQEIAVSLDVVADTVTYQYLYGGNDGAPGSFLSTLPVSTCVAPTTTTAAVTTTTAPPAAKAVQATPAFTG